MTNVGRVLLCIGCDDYHSLKSLSGAEADAKNVHALLTRPDIGDYPSETARLLLSPTFSEIDEAIEDLLTTNPEIDTFTFFFAGHGVASKGSYYLCAKDTVSGRLATSGWSLNRLFEIINERAPAQCNIIIDACESGGLVGSLGTLLKPELIGVANSSGISIFATSAANEYSIDTSDGGVGTTQLLRVLSGEVPLQTHYPYLDLVDVGRTSSALISNVAKSIAEPYAPGTFTPQTPVVWGMNLFGQSRFCKNPAYDGAHPGSVYSMLAITPGSAAGLIIRNSSAVIWSLFYESPDILAPRKVFDTLQPIIEKLGNEDDAVRFIAGMTATLRARFLESSDSFADAQATATSIALLLEWCGKSGLAESYVAELARILVGQLEACFSDLSAEIGKYPERLTFEGLADYFFLPVRISKIMGWAATLVWIKAELGDDYVPASIMLENLIKRIIDEYGACLTIVSDEQCPFLLIFLSVALKYGMVEIGEQVLGAVTAQFFRDRAKIARTHLDPELIYSFLKKKEAQDFAESLSIIAHPSESLSMLLMMAHLYGLEETVDPFLKDLDHESHFVFIPQTHVDFSQETIRSGSNHNFQIGHGVWTTSDFVRRWMLSCASQLAADTALGNKMVRIGAICSSLIFPDRSPWFLIEPSGDLTQ